MWDQKKTLRIAKPINVVDELQRIIESEPQAKDMFSPFLLNAIADLSIIAECARQLDLVQPWASLLPELMKEKDAQLQAKWTAKQTTWSRMIDGLINSGKVLHRYGTPSDKRFYYPVDQRRTRQTTEQMRQAEANLDKFWELADNILRSKAGKLEGTHIRKLLEQPKIMQRTPEWIDPPPAPRKGAAKAKEPQVEAIIKPLSEVYFDLERRTERTIANGEASKQGKSKQKTRGTTASDTASNADTIISANPHDTQPTFSVDARALKVFKTLFYTPSPGSTPGEVSWIDFVYALGTTGFRAEKLYGSVWQFSPTRLDVERAIQFHEPHPEKKIAFFVARRHGRRLHRAYGWHGNMFVLA